MDASRKDVGIEVFLGRANEIINTTNMELAALGKWSEQINTIQVMTDYPNLSHESLKAKFPQYSFVLPGRQVADLAVGGQEAAPGSVADLTYDLLADIESMVQAEVFIGSHSNLFWLIWTLRQTRPSGPGMTCWLNIADKSAPISCDGDGPGGFWALNTPCIPFP